MAEEFQSGVCGGNWWMNSSKIIPFMGSGLSPCSALMSTTTSDHLDHMGMITNYGPSSWQMMTDQLKPIRSSCNYKDQNSTTTTAADNSDSGGSSSIFMDSSLPLIGFGLSSSSSSSSDWNQALLSGDGRRGESYNSSGLQEIQKDWSPEDQDSITINNNNFKLGMSNIQDFSNLDHQQAAAAAATATGGHGLIMNCSSTTTTNSTSPPHSYGYSTTTTTSSLIQSLFDPDPPEQSQQQPIFNNNNNNNYFAVNNNLNNDRFSLSPTTTTCFLKLQHQQQQQNSLQFSNNTPFLNGSAATTETNDMTIRTNNFLLPTSQPQFLGSSFDEKPNVPNLTTTQKRPNNQELCDSGTLAKKGSEPAFKRPRMETPSPLPTFKVRKEKLGDRITALQQLVSPFGKTDTASVLHEAIEYIKYLHDQVSILSTPYMKNNGNPIQHQQQGSSSDERLLLKGEARQDLKSRGLCLVPISSTFPVANETPADFWTPTFGVGSTFG